MYDKKNYEWLDCDKESGEAKCCVFTIQKKIYSFLHGLQYDSEKEHVTTTTLSCNWRRAEELIAVSKVNHLSTYPSENGTGKRKRQAIQFNVTMWRLGIIFFPPCLCWEPHTILLEGSDFMGFDVAGDNKACLSFRLKCPKILLNFNQIWSLSRYFKISLLHIISLKSVEWEPNWYMPADRLTDTKKVGSNRHFLGERGRV
jgi:hypothetical protein